MKAKPKRKTIPRPQPKRQPVLRGASKPTAILAPAKPITAIVANRERTLKPAEIELLKKTVAKGCSNEEFSLFMLVCKKKKLDPFSKQVYAVKWPGRNGAEGEMVIIIGVNGFRSMAARYHKKDFGGTSAATFTWPNPPQRTPTANRLIPETATVEAWRRSGGRGSATVYWEEFAPVDMSASRADFWRRMPKQMLAKCAEVHALKKVFPDLSDIYSEEEVAQRLQDLTDGGRQISSGGIAPSGSVVDQREQSRVNAKLIADAKQKGMWCEKHGCVTTSCPSDGHTTAEMDDQWDASQRAKGKDPEGRTLDVKPLSTSDARGASATQSAGRTGEVGTTSPAGTTVVRGVMHRCIGGMTTEKKVPYRDVRIGQAYYKCWHRTMFSYLDQFRNGGFIVEVWIDKRNTIQGLVRVGPLLFEADGKTPRNTSREPGSDE